MSLASPHPASGPNTVDAVVVDVGIGAPSLLVGGKTGFSVGILQTKLRRICDDAAAYRTAAERIGTAIGVVGGAAV